MNRHLYHLSEIDHGETLHVARRTPKDASTGEPPVPRLCVAPNVPACVAARLFAYRDVYVYRTPRPKRGIAPRKVWDARVTGERWLIPPDVLVKIDVIPKDVIWKAVCLSHLYHKTTKKPASIRLRIAEYMLAAFIMPHTVDAEDRRGLRWLGRQFEIHDAVEWIKTEIDKCNSRNC